MTREDARDALWSNGHGDSNWLIDKIFNDHEAQLKAKDEEIAKYQIAIDKQSKRCEALKQFIKPDGFPRDCFGNIEIT